MRVIVGILFAAAAIIYFCLFTGLPLPLDFGAWVLGGCGIAVALLTVGSALRGR